MVLDVSVKQNDDGVSLAMFLADKVESELAKKPVAPLADGDTLGIAQEIASISGVINDSTIWSLCRNAMAEMPGLDTSISFPGPLDLKLICQDLQEHLSQRSVAAQSDTQRDAEVNAKLGALELFLGRFSSRVEVVQVRDGMINFKSGRWFYMYNSDEGWIFQGDAQSRSSACIDGVQGIQVFIESGVQVKGYFQGGAPQGDIEITGKATAEHPFVRYLLSENLIAQEDLLDHNGEISTKVLMLGGKIHHKSTVVQFDYDLYSVSCEYYGDAKQGPDKLFLPKGSDNGTYAFRKRCTAALHTGNFAPYQISFELDRDGEIVYTALVGSEQQFEESLAQAARERALFCDPFIS